MNRAIPIALVLLLAALLCPSAVAAGGPVFGTDAPNGIVGVGGTVRYQALQHGGRTEVVAVHTNGGQVSASRDLEGRWGIPGVALDGSATGLSADGTTLVVAESRRTLWRPRTRLVVLRAGDLHVYDRITLRGNFSVDAISPDGGTLYLIEGLSRRNPLDYRVRAYDLDRGRILPRPIVDRREPDEEMEGYAIARASSSDGRWNYTLYDRPSGGEPFIHALDTERARARCIDLDEFGPLQDYATTRLDLDEGRGALKLLFAGRTQAVVDTRTFEVGLPRPAAAAPAREPADEGGAGGGGGLPWQLLAVAAAAAALGSGALLLRRRPAPDAAPDPEREEEADTTFAVWR
jgi:hypothetical protein